MAKSDSENGSHHKKSKKHKKDKKKHKKDKHNRKRSNERGDEDKGKTGRIKKVKLLPDSSRDQIQFKKDAREMFQKMAQTIEFAKPRIPGGEETGPTPTLKDQILSGSILKEMYHKAKPVAPNADTVQFYDNDNFMTKVKEKVKEIHQCINEPEITTEDFKKGAQLNPEAIEISDLPPKKEDIPLSFRDRLQSKSALASQILSSLGEREEQDRLKEEKNKKNKYLSGKLSYMPSAHQIQQQKQMRTALTEDESFQRKLNAAINKKKKEKKEKMQKEHQEKEDDSRERKRAKKKLKKQLRKEEKMKKSLESESKLQKQKPEQRKHSSREFSSSDEALSVGKGSSSN